MKKILLILLLLILPFMLFAKSINVGGGVTFSFITASTAESYQVPKVYYKSSGLGFDINGSFELNNNLLIWANFDMTFSFDVKYRTNNEVNWVSTKESMKSYSGYGQLKLSMNYISFSIGVAYKLDLDRNLPINLALGGGLFFDRQLVKITASNNSSYESITEKYKNLGLSFYMSGKYKLSEDLDFNLILIPHIGLFNIIETSNSDISVQRDGFSLSFSMPIIFGLSYSF